MLRYVFQRSACAVMAFLSGVAIMLTVMSITALALARNVDFVKENIAKSESLLLQEIDAAAAEAAGLAGLPEEALTGAVNGDNADVLNAEIARMFVHSYTADYSESTALYNEFYNKLVAYAEESGDAINEKQLVATASLAVNCVNNRLSGSDTSGVQLFRLSGDMRLLYIIVGSIVCVALSIVLIIVLTEGRHRQFSYFGMGLTIAGFLLTLLPFALLQSGIVTDYRYCVSDVYNTMVMHCYQALLHIVLPLGIPFIIAGVVMLLLNYNYYRKKLLKVRESRERMDKVKDMYMDTPQQQAPLTEQERAKKTFLDIDFDE